MKQTYNNIINSHSGKTAYVIGLGPSLKKNLEQIEYLSQTQKDKNVFLCCNLYQQATAIDSDFWLIANNQASMQLTALTESLNAYKGTFIYSEEIDKSEPPLCNYIQMYSQGKVISELVAEYCGQETPPYTYVHSVVVHLTALAILLGCKEILIAGCDFDYRNGYVKEDFNVDGLKIGVAIMPQFQDHAINDLMNLKKYAKAIGVDIKTIDVNTRLSEALNK